MQENKNTPWFKCWFDSPYYPILYRHRNNKEAELFIDNLINYLHPANNSQFLDLACGNGRHALYLNKKGYNVTGIDLSPENIAHASKLASNENIRFYVSDMRKIVWEEQFDYVINLFTSFGYFENDVDNYVTINAVSKALKPGGFFVLDFMNVRKIIADIVAHEVKTIDNIKFELTKKIENRFIVKDICFTDEGKAYHFQERVKALTLNDFENYLAASKLKIIDLRGNYQLDKFNEETSERLIIIAQKSYRYG